MSNHDKLYRDIYEACLKAAESVGPQQWKEMSWFGHWRGNGSSVVKKAA